MVDVEQEFIEYVKSGGDPVSDVFLITVMNGGPTQFISVRFTSDIPELHNRVDLANSPLRASAGNSALGVDMLVYLWSIEEYRIHIPEYTYLSETLHHCYLLHEKMTLQNRESPTREDVYDTLSQLQEYASPRSSGALTYDSTIH